MENQLEIQVNDVQEALGNLALCLRLAIDDKEQFIKEYGSRLYATFISISAQASINECKINDILYNK